MFKELAVRSVQQEEDLSEEDQDCPAPHYCSEVSSPSPRPPAPGIGHHTYHRTGRGRRANMFLQLVHLTVGDIGSEIVMKW